MEEKLSNLRALGKMETLFGGLITFLLFLLLIGPGIGKFQILVTIVPFALCLFAGIGIIKQKEWGERINKILLPLLALWFIVYLLFCVHTWIVTYSVPGSGGTPIRILSILPSLVLAIGLSINISILRLFRIENKEEG